MNMVFAVIREIQIRVVNNSMLGKVVPYDLKYTVSSIAMIFSFIFSHIKVTKMVV